eukprot:COSAG05_NODE_9405_length_626_cov_1.523719_1_plen_85_part_10
MYLSARLYFCLDLNTSNAVLLYRYRYHISTIELPVISQFKVRAPPTPRCLASRATLAWLQVEPKEEADEEVKECEIQLYVNHIVF